MKLTARFVFCALLVCQPVRIFSIGDADGADWEVLSRLGNAAFDALDNLYVLMARAPVNLGFWFSMRPGNSSVSSAVVAVVPESSGRRATYLCSLPVTSS